MTKVRSRAAAAAVQAAPAAAARGGTMRRAAPTDRRGVVWSNVCAQEAKVGQKHCMTPGAHAGNSVVEGGGTGARA